MARALAFAILLGAAAGAASATDAARGARYGLGRAATAAEISAWDIDVRPDGHGVRRGRGSVAQGQEIYDAKCAACHGTFGESNLYMVIAGGVRPEDLPAGRASGLLSADVVRTLGNKLNHVTTLWDYIFRAMPWAAPQSLTIDETYAVTAYVLHLNDIVPADFVLDDSNLLTLQMPNRNGLTRRHGLGRVGGTPDVQGSRCMRDCGGAPQITSRLPDYALNQHGQLRDQFRTLGPLGAVDSTRSEQPAAARGVEPAPAGARDIVARRACTTCHGIDHKVVGPAFTDVGARYRTRAQTESGTQSNVVEALTQRIRQGSVGAWGSVPMPAQSAIRDDELLTVARWIVQGAP